MTALPTDQIQLITQTPPVLLFATVLTVIIQSVKTLLATMLPGTKVPSALLPFVALGTGAVTYPLVAGWSGDTVLVGMAIGASSIGVHQVFKQTEQPD